MANRKIMLPQYGTVMKRGVLYYRTRIKDTNGKLVAIYAKTPEELYNKETLALEQIENATFHRKTPTVAEYCEKWLLMQSVHVRATTLTDYTSKVRRHIIAELGDKRMGEVSLDDIQLALVPVSKKSASVYKSVVSFTNLSFAQQWKAGSLTITRRFISRQKVAVFHKRIVRL